MHDRHVETVRRLIEHEVPRPVDCRAAERHLHVFALREVRHTTIHRGAELESRRRI